MRARARRGIRSEVPFACGTGGSRRSGCGRLVERAPALPALLALVALAALGCTGKVLPLSAQAGSTVAIPLGGARDLGPVGFGGADVSDPQRGEIVYRLDAPAGPVELVTRASTALGGHAGAGVARSGGLLYQVVSLVDVPSDAPLGTHPVDVLHRRRDPATGARLETPIPYEGELSVLPAAIEVAGPAGTETIAGAPTPFEAWICNAATGTCDWQRLFAALVSSAVPDPALRLALDAAVWAVELEVTYPQDVIDVVDVYETPLARVNRRATVWHADDGAGRVVLSAAASVAAFRSLSVAFALDDPAAALLDPAEVSVRVLRAWDRDGREVAVGASVGRVF